jgi:hypothetical protein
VFFTTDHSVLNDVRGTVRCDQLFGTTFSLPRLTRVHFRAGRFRSGCTTSDLSKAGTRVFAGGSSATLPSGQMDFTIIIFINDIYDFINRNRCALQSLRRHHFLAEWSEATDGIHISRYRRRWIYRSSVM